MRKYFHLKTNGTIREMEFSEYIKIYKSRRNWLIAEVTEEYVFVTKEGDHVLIPIPQLKEIMSCGWKQ